MERSHTSWSHDAAPRDRGSGEEWTRGVEGAWLAASHTHTPAHIFTEHRLSPKPIPLRWPDEAVGYNLMLRRQKQRGPEQRLVLVSSGGNESVGMAHRQTDGWEEGPVTSEEGPARIRSL